MTSEPVERGRDERVAELEAELGEMRRRLEENEETLRAIRGGEVDAFVIQLPDEQRIYQLRDSEHVYHAFVEQMRDAALTLDDDNTIMYANPRFLEMLGQSQGRVLGSNLIDHISAEDAYLSQALLQRAHQRESSAELSLVGRDDSHVPVNALAFPVDVDGTRMVCVLMTDMTEIHRYRYDLEQMVDSRTAELAGQTARIRQVLQANNQLVGRLAVELEKPLADLERVAGGLTHNARDLRDDETVPLTRDGIVLVENSLVRLNALLQDVAMLAEVESGDARLEHSSVNLKALVTEAAEEARVPAADRSVEYVLDLPQEEVSFIADGRKLKQTLVGLLLICAESAEIGPVRVRAEVTPDLRAQFEICLPGHVLPLDDIRVLLRGELEPGAAHRITRTVPALSVWATARVARFMHGTLTVNSDETHDCFTFSVPV